MHSAPAVSYPVGRSRDAGRLLSGLWALGAACAGAAVLHLDDMLGGRAALLALGVACAGAATWWFRRGARSGELRFDGLQWSLSGAQPVPAARAELCLDLQFLLLLRLVAPEGPRCWLWLERRAQPSRWPDLRRAVYSRAPTPPLMGRPADATLPVAPSSSLP